ncbi:hypothetical protein F442_17679 [Phytophthora nicotianae P10297]|uniref:Uncharacterized protein n=1 Tax=Phytophthora nicotianae P10297 TaxID=1317064 RepID=W2YGV9_PHYNI|nr:hypothetical protein F442_17679 [Phytophthora nicotianae P10297]
MTYLIHHYPALKALAADSPANQRLEACAVERGFSVNDLAWSSYLASVSSSKPDTSVEQDTTADVTKHPVFRHQTAMIEQIIQVNKTLDARLSVMEAKISPQQPSECTNSEQPHKRRRTSPASSLKDAWFTWYTQEPRMWSSTDPETKHARSTAKQVVAFLKLFLERGFKLVESSPQYRDDVLTIGESAETALLTFLKQHNITARGPQNVLKSMRKLHKDDSLNQHILRYQQLQGSGHILDPAPSHTTNVLS